MAEAAEFTLILTRVDDGVGPDVSQTMVEKLSLEARAEQLAASAPLILRRDLTKADVKQLTPVLKELSQSGLEFRVTARDTQSLPRLESGPEGPVFQMGNRAFSCPSCGETFLFQQTEVRLGG